MHKQQIFIQQYILEQHLYTIPGTVGILNTIKGLVFPTIYSWEIELLSELAFIWALCNLNYVVSLNSDKTEV